MIFDNLLDNTETDLIQHFAESNAFIDNALSTNDTNRVLVHCQQGISRSGAFCTAFMVAHRNMKVDEAIKLGRSKRMTFYPNKYFVE